MALALPPAGQLIAGPNGQLDKSYWEFLFRVKELLAQIDAAFSGQIGDSTLGTAAVEDVGTSGANVPLLNGVNAWSGQQYFPIQTLVDAANIAWDLNTKQTAVVTLSASRILDNPTNMKPGATYMLAVIAGAFTLTYGTAYKFPAATVPVLANNCLLSFFCPFDGAMWCVDAKGFG